jgi:hypothetical protein
MSPKACWILQEEVIPRLRAVIPRSVRCVGSEDAEELIQDATVMAARMIISAEKNQKKFGGSVNDIYFSPLATTIIPQWAMSCLVWC